MFTAFFVFSAITEETKVGSRSKVGIKIKSWGLGKNFGNRQLITNQLWFDN